jgi:hypothetical protein
VQVDPYVRSHAESPSLEGWFLAASSLIRSRGPNRHRGRLNQPRSSTRDPFNLRHECQRTQARDGAAGHS